MIYLIALLWIVGAILSVAIQNGYFRHKYIDLLVSDKEAQLGDMFLSCCWLIFSLICCPVILVVDIFLSKFVYYGLSLKFGSPTEEELTKWSKL